MERTDSSCHFFDLMTSLGPPPPSSNAASSRTSVKLVKEDEMEIMGKPEAITEVSTTAYDRRVLHWAAFFTFCLIGDR